MMAAGTSQDPGCHLFPEGAETSNLSLHRSNDPVITCISAGNNVD